MKSRKRYRSEAATKEGFVQQLAVQYVTHGYWFYVPGWIPEQKDPSKVDAALIERYRIGWSSAERARRKRAGRANIQLLRFRSFFVIAATHGQHEFFWPTEDGGESKRDPKGNETRIRDFRKHPLHFEGYSISYRGGHACVRIGPEEYRRRKAFFLDLATRRSVEDLAEMFTKLPFEPYKPVQNQVRSIWRAVNRARAEAGLEEVSWRCLRRRRRIVAPFGVEPEIHAAGRLSTPSENGPPCELVGGGGG